MRRDHDRRCRKADKRFYVRVASSCPANSRFCGARAQCVSALSCFATRYKRKITTHAAMCFRTGVYIDTPTKTFTFRTFSFPRFEVAFGLWRVYVRSNECCRRFSSPAHFTVLASRRPTEKNVMYYYCVGRDGPFAF